MIIQIIHIIFNNYNDHPHQKVNIHLNYFYHLSPLIMFAQNE